MIAAQYQQLAIRVDALELRERVMLLIVCIVLLFFLVDTVGYQPIIKQQQSLLQDINEQEVQLEVLRARTGQFYDETASEPTMAPAMLQQELISFGSKLQSRLDNMLAPDKAASILEQVLNPEEGLSLKTVNTRMLPLTAIDADMENNVAIDDIHRYELELELEGSYLETLSYLRALEALPWNFFWSGISFATTEYPKAIVNLSIYTLSQPES